jgi:hypothetical protein
MDYVYICRDGDNEELRYSIRSVVANANPGNIWVVGGKPDWYCGDFISVSQNENKYKNVYNNLIAICNSDKISNPFVIMNDDFYIIKKIQSIPSFHNGSLLKKFNAYEEFMGLTNYVKKLLTTYKKIKLIGIKDPLDYELHVPMIMEKEKLNEVLKYGDKFLYRSMYGNMFNIDGIETKDVKIYSEGIFASKQYDINKNNSPFLSSVDSSFYLILKSILELKFLHKTKYEK